ncbi:unnamed protein product [Ceratitis capitata]|uniref:(Mediterranean fruit fly) hypothetical protein n=1 Tax=Ceratitis capitata TaxID=7213 RepID=A0A811VA52_CERCA|nr:unnamed protein product [Ceratitis capitata]
MSTAMSTTAATNNGTHNNEMYLDCSLTSGRQADPIVYELHLHALVIISFAIFFSFLCLFQHLLLFFNMEMLSAICNKFLLSSLIFVVIEISSLSGKEGERVKNCHSVK